MNEVFLKKLINKLIDWLIVLLGVVFVLWFSFTLPVFSSQANNKMLLNISQQNLKAHVKVLVEDYAPRTIAYDNLNITSHYIHDELGKFGKVEYQPFWTLVGNYSNVVLELGPDTKEVFVIGAHYDAENASLDIDGNASGIAALIELARHLSQIQGRLPIRVQIAAYPLSQISSTNVENMGSYYHAEALLKSQKEVRLMVSLDGVGHFNNDKQSQNYPYKFLRHFYPDKGNYISLIGRLQDYTEVRQMKKSFVSASSLPLYSFNVPDNYSPTNSLDHLNYQKHGFPAVLITDTAKYRKLNNESKDVVEQLDYENMAKLVKSLYQVVIDSPPVTQEHKLVQEPQKIVKTRGGVL